MVSMKCRPCLFSIAVKVDVVPSTLDSRVYHAQDVQKVPWLSEADYQLQVPQAWDSTEALPRSFSEEPVETHPARSKTDAASTYTARDPHACTLYKTPAHTIGSRLQHRSCTSQNRTPNQHRQLYQFRSTAQPPGAGELVPSTKPYIDKRTPGHGGRHVARPGRMYAIDPRTMDRNSEAQPTVKLVAHNADKTSTDDAGCHEATELHRPLPSGQTVQQRGKI
jgi:hypothetical protein